MGQKSVGEILFISNDLKTLSIDGWYELCQGRDCWYQRCREGISLLSPFAENLCTANSQPEGGPFTGQCERPFRRAETKQDL